MKKLTQKEVIKKFQNIHNTKYDYSLVDYSNAHTKICIICPEHGEFWQEPNSHWTGCGCPKCKSEKLSLTFISNQTDFVNKALKVHKKFIYDKVQYINSQTKVCIICPEHGEFWQTPSKHLFGQGCSKCSNIINSNQLKSNKEEFIKKAQNKHKHLYEYDVVKYINALTKVCIICPEHGEFWQTPANHLSGQGCPFCKKSKGEKQIEQWLKENSIDFIPQKRFEDCKNIYRLSFDFYIPSLNFCIEYDGQQHFKPTGFGGNPQEKFQRTIENDRIKNNYCQHKNIKLLRISYKELKKIKEILKTKLL